MESSPELPSQEFPEYLVKPHHNTTSSLPTLVSDCGMVTVSEVEIRLDKISFLIYKASLLQAHQEYELLMEEIQQTMSSADENETKEGEGIQELMEKNQEMLNELKERYREINLTVNECTSSHEEWTLGSERFGVPTYYRVDDDGLLCLRLEGSQETPIFEQMAVLYEVALHNEWVPFCDQSNLLKKMCKFKSLSLVSSSNSLLT